MRSALPVFFLLVLFLPVSFIEATSHEEENAPTGIVTCDGPDCTVCELIATGQSIFDFLILISAIIAAVLFAVAGLKMVTAAGNPGQITAARNIFTNVMIGFIILLAAWLIVDTIIKMLVNDQVIGEGTEFGPWNEIECKLQPPAGAVTTPDTTDITPIEGTEYVPNDVALSHGNAVEALSTRENITLTSTGGEQNVYAACNTTGCTSFDGIQGETVNNVLSFADRCTNCDIRVVGGTERNAHTPGSAHYTGDKVDIDDTASVNNYVRTNFTPVGTRSDGADMYRDPQTGAIWAFEDGRNAHWDVLRAGAAPTLLQGT